MNHLIILNLCFKILLGLIGLGLIILLFKEFYWGKGEKQ